VGRNFRAPNRLLKDCRPPTVPTSARRRRTSRYGSPPGPSKARTPGRKYLRRWPVARTSRLLRRSGTQLPQPDFHQGGFIRAVIRSMYLAELRSAPESAQPGITERKLNTCYHSITQLRGERMRSLDLPRDAGAVYKPRAGVISRHHDDTTMRNENQAQN
jgi:hypothetical protein